MGTEEKKDPGELTVVGEQISEPEPPPKSSPPSPPPDGGLDAWLVVIGGWCCFFVSFGWAVSIGILQAYYQDNQLKGFSSSEVSWILSTEIFVLQFLSPFVGHIFDSYGPRYLLLGGTVIYVFGMMMLSLSSSYYQIFLSQSLCGSIGASALFYTGNNSVSTWFGKRRALALGLVSSGGSVAGVIFPIVFNQLVDKIGFGWTIRVEAFIMLGMCAVANLLCRSRLVHKPKRFSAKLLLSQYADKNFLLVTLGCFVFFEGFWIPYNYITNYALSHGMSSSLAGYQLVILNAASTPGRIFPAWAGDKIGRFNMLCAIIVLSAVFTLGLWIPALSAGPIIAYSVMYGFLSGAFISLVFPVIAQISDVTQIGLRVGALFIVDSLGTLTGEPIGGALQACDDGGYRWLQVFAGVCMAAALLLVGTARMRIRRSFLARI